MASAKGFCFGWGLPIVLVPTLEALAHRFPNDARVLCPVMDARKKEVYSAVFRWEEGVLKRLSKDMAVSPEALPDHLPEGEQAVLFGDGLKSYAALLRDRLGNRALFVEGQEGLPSAGMVAILGERLFLAGAAADPRTAIPAYIRPSEAEFKRIKSDSSNN
jgi:tRNA threonylcarbamoyladenosine biosynthesis protein TsaB